MGRSTDDMPEISELEGDDEFKEACTLNVQSSAPSSPASKSPSPNTLRGLRSKKLKKEKEKEVICLDSDEDDSLDLASSKASSTSGSTTNIKPPPTIVKLESQKRPVSPPALSATRKTLPPPPATLQPYPPRTSASTTFSSASSTPSPSILGNRAQEEAERLARAKRRKEEARAAESEGSENDTARPKKAARTSASVMTDKGKTVVTPTTIPLTSFYGGGRTLRGDSGSSTGPSAESSKTSSAAGSGVEMSSRGTARSTGGSGTLKQTQLSFGNDYKAPGGKRMGIQYPRGVVKKTWCDGVERSEDDVRIEEVLQKDTCRYAILSAFQWHSEWILEQFNISKTKFLLVMQAKDEAERSRLRQVFSVLSRVQLCFPNMEGQINCMHSKLMLLFHDGYMRLVIPSANLVKFDWGEMGGIMENTVFIIDLPKRSPEITDSSNFTIFARELIYFCKSAGYPDDVLQNLHKLDYSQTSHLAFVHSIGGSHTGGLDSKEGEKPAWMRTGYPGLREAVRDLGLSLGAAGKGAEVDYVTSSVGALNREFLSNIYRACLGDNGLTELQSRGTGRKSTSTQSTLKGFFNSSPSTALATAATSSSNAVPITDWDEDIRLHFRVYFPSHETVVNSKGGANAGGTICFQPKWWKSPTFPKEVIRDCVNVRKGVLMHSKLIFTRPPKLVKTDRGSVEGWAYIGSANLSESAWGKLVQDKSTKSPKLNLKNWECGVLYPVYSPGGGLLSDDVQEVDRGEGEGERGDDVAGKAAPRDLTEVFSGHVPVPIVIPAKKMTMGRSPWFYMEDY